MKSKFHSFHSEHKKFANMKKHIRNTNSEIFLKHSSKRIEGKNIKFSVIKERQKNLIIRKSDIKHFIIDHPMKNKIETDKIIKNKLEMRKKPKINNWEMVKKTITSADLLNTRLCKMKKDNQCNNISYETSQVSQYFNTKKIKIRHMIYKTLTEEKSFSKITEIQNDQKSQIGRIVFKLPCGLMSKCNDKEEKNSETAESSCNYERLNSLCIDQNEKLKMMDSNNFTPHFDDNNEMSGNRQHINEISSQSKIENTVLDVCDTDHNTLKNVSEKITSSENKTNISNTSSSETLCKTDSKSYKLMHRPPLVPRGIYD